MSQFYRYDLDGDYDRKLQETRRWEDPVTQMPKDQVVSTAEPADDKKSKPGTCLWHSVVRARRLEGQLRVSVRAAEAPSSGCSRSGGQHPAGAGAASDG